MRPELRTWEEVLADVEADAERTVALLGAPVDSPLPADVPVVLPPLGTMPPVPEHLRERIGQLRQRIDDLQEELRATLREWQLPPSPMPVTVPAAPRFLDRRI
jgi:hypothetical protein